MLLNDLGDLCNRAAALNREATVAREPLPSSEARYALYFVPSETSVWWHFGSAWLGRDALGNAPPPRPQVAGLDDDYLQRITAEPRRYGIHATLKAPLKLATGYQPHDVYRQAALLAVTLTPVRLTPLRLTVIDGFLALTLPHDSVVRGAVAAIAGQCVNSLDNLRAPVHTTESAPGRPASRQRTGLTPRQQTMLLQWGYPYVFDEFRFHITLTGRLPRAEQGPVLDALEPMVRALNDHALMLDGLAVCVQPQRDAPFVLTRRYGFDGSMRVYHHEQQS